ncbi:MAG TPA: preprotein translocase subunit SecY, partial [Gallionellaceae bacterium]|nr:preprotein translocase subunit SecY [Gallionellaceae bacterium]
MASVSNAAVSKNKYGDLSKRLWFLLGALVVYRVGAHIPVPGIDPNVLAELFKSQQGGILGMFNMFSGGALSRFTIFALGIMPYISASIIMQLLTTVVPWLEKLSKEGEGGRRQITKYTRYATVALAGVQGSALSMWMHSMRAGDGSYIVPQEIPAPIFHFVTILTLITGTIFLMWLGEQITERG